MIKERYCSFEVAKLLKEKGFDGEVRAYYMFDNETKESELILDDRLDTPNLWGDDYCAAPTHQMAMDWLREVHNIFIEISVDAILKDEGYQWALYYNSTKEIRPYFGWEDSYEETIEAALKYCLTKLI